MRPDGNDDVPTETPATLMILRLRSQKKKKRKKKQTISHALLLLPYWEGKKIILLFKTHLILVPSYSLVLLIERLSFKALIL